MGRAVGVSERQLREIDRFESSEAFSEIEKLVLRYAEALTSTPAGASDELFAALKEAFDPGQLVELTSAIAWENYRARFNRAFEIGPDGFSEGAFCVVPDRASSSRESGDARVAAPVARA